MNRTRLIIIVVAVALISLWIIRFPIIEWWVAQPDAVRQMQLGDTIYQLEIADSVFEQRRGLMDRDQLSADRGMYFQFADSKERSFWMKNTKIPLDLIWVDEGVVIGLTTGVQPEPGVSDLQLRLYSSPGPADAVIELNAGEVAQNGLKIGDRIGFDSGQ